MAANKRRVQSFWAANVPEARRRPYPVQRGPLDVEVAVVGGGLIGCTIAQVFASSGVRVGLLEAQRIGAQATGSAPGVIVPEPSVSLTTLQAAYGRRAARAIWDASRHGALDFVTLLRRLGVKADAERVEIDSYLSEREDPRELERERDLRRAMEIDGQWLTPSRAQTHLQTPTPGAIRVTSAAVFDPYRACLRLARAAASRGAQIFEKSPVVRIKQVDDRLGITTGRGGVTADRVIIATGGPTRQFQKLAHRFRPLVTYRVATAPLPVALRRGLPASSIVLREATCPAHVLRWTADRRLLFAGVERMRLPERSRPAALAQHTAQLMYELSLLYPHLSGVQADYAWDAAISASDDGLPYIGPHRHYPRHLFALGAGRADGGTALVAARILLRHYKGAPEKNDQLWGFGR